MNEVAVAPQEDRTLAMITHLSGIVAGFIVPLIIWLINKDKPEKSFLIDQSKEALNFQITLLLAYVACMILSFVLIGALLMPLVWIASVVFMILAAVKANSGRMAKAINAPATFSLKPRDDNEKRIPHAPQFLPRARFSDMRKELVKCEKPPRT